MKADKELPPLPIEREFAKVAAEEQARREREAQHERAVTATIAAARDAYLRYEFDEVEFEERVVDALYLTASAATPTIADLHAWASPCCEWSPGDDGRGCRISGCRSRRWTRELDHRRRVCARRGERPPLDPRTPRVEW